ncbi:MAG: acylphosphatase [Treponema sp.]|nr:acylphosphatase [Candidatus Treponema scatequi]
MKNLIRQQLRFKGRVQGVGFRYTANSVAQSLGLTGWVYNDFDGSVLMEVQGTKVEIDNLISRLESGTFIEIDSVDRTDLPVDTSEKYFKIKSW